MRVTSDLFVSALLRRAFAVGGFGAILRKGAMEAGAIFLVTRDRTGLSRLYGPAPQTDYGEGTGDRLFALLAETTEPDGFAERLRKEERFDPDFWVVEIDVDEKIFAEMVAVRKP